MSCDRPIVLFPSSCIGSDSLGVVNGRPTTFFVWLVFECGRSAYPMNAIATPFPHLQGVRSATIAIVILPLRGVLLPVPGPLRCSPGACLVLPQRYVPGPFRCSPGPYHPLLTDALSCHTGESSHLCTRGILRPSGPQAFPGRFCPLLHRPRFRRGVDSRRLYVVIRRMTTGGQFVAGCARTM